MGRTSLITLINESLLEKIEEYTELNSINKTEFINKILENGYNLEVYGSTPFHDCETKKVIEEIKTIKDIGLIELIPIPEKTTSFIGEIEHNGRTEEPTPFPKATERKIKAK